MTEETPYVRRHHPPDDIIDGKPKWARIKIRKLEEGAEGQSEVHEREINIDRLNPTRNMVDELEDGFNDDAEETQRVLVNMMADLQNELVVTLGDTRVDPKLEEQLMAENQKWECYKKKHNIKEWVPMKAKVAIAPMFKTVEKKTTKKGQKRKSMADPEPQGGGTSNKKMKRVARLPSSPRKGKVRALNQTM